MTIRRRGCCNATGAKRWKKCFWMWRADASARPRDERRRGDVFAAPRRRDGAALLVSVALVLRAADRADLLADRADADVGLSADLPRRADQPLCARRRRVDRRRDAVDVLFRGQLGFSISFLEEMWSRNLGNLMISPLRPAEFVAALMVMSIIRLAIGMVPVTLLAIWFFGFNLWALGIALVAFFANLMITGWAVGIFVSGLVLRNGLGAETFAWSIMFLFLPLTCVYYPVAVLPAWLQAVAWSLPPTYVFEGMRGLLMEHTFRADFMIQSFALNALMFALAVCAFLALLAPARRNGTLMQTGE